MDPDTSDTRRGNSGAWFLEAVGKATAETLEPVPFPISDDEDQGIGTTATDGSNPPPGSTTELVGQMWRQTGTQDPLEDWQPADLDRYVARKRNFRWSVWILLVLIAGAVATGVILAPRLTERQAAEEAQRYAESLADLQATLPSTQQVLRELTEPRTRIPDLANLVPDLSRLQAAADAVIEDATGPLPQPLPMLPSGPLDDLEPSRDRMARLGSDATALAGRLAAGIEYRTLTDGFLDAGELPVTAPTTDIAGIQERIALSFADATAALARVPGDQVFAAHREALSAAVDGHRDWEAAYIGALRNEDADAATELIAERALLLATLENDLVPALAELRRSLDQAILELDQEIRTAISELPA
jgi:hypothetical protein